MTSAAFLPLLLVGLFAPGWLLGKALGTPASAAAAFLGSAAMLLQLLVIFDAVNISVTPTHLALGLTGICTVIAGAAVRRRDPIVEIAQHKSWAFQWRPYHTFLIPAALGLGAISVRTIIEPLSGFDNVFRWDYLARKILSEASLTFYPAVTAEDFVNYAWCDGIAPLISTLYVWGYATIGNSTSLGPTTIVVTQAILLFVGVYQLAADRGGPSAGCAAVAVLATSPILLWSVAMGQETGLTALSVVMMFLCLERYRAQHQPGWLIWSGIAAGTSALAREYGLAFIALGIFVLLWQRTPRRDLMRFAGAAAITALPWFGRNWLKTGHPLYSHAFGGIFPANPVHVEVQQTYVEMFGFASHPREGLALVGWAFIFALLPLGAGIAQALRTREHRPYLGAIVLVIMLWIWSVGQTAAGHDYSLRVLSPAIAIGSALAGMLLACFATRTQIWTTVVLIFAFACDAAGRSLYFPVHARSNWWALPRGTWREFGEISSTVRDLQIWQGIANAANGHYIVVSHPVFHAHLARHGARPVPFFSPAVRFLFETPCNFASSIQQLRNDGFRFIVLATPGPMPDPFLARHSFFQDLRQISPAMTNGIFSVYDLHKISPLTSGMTAGK
jgi:hypothetical protein